MKLKKGYFKKKLYCILNKNNQEIIKASGIDSSKLNYKSFLKLFNGESLNIEKTSFNIEWKDLNIKVLKSNIRIKGLTGKVKTIYNTNDVNYKYISFPVKYNLIVHPEYLYITETENYKDITENILKVSTPSVNIIQDESDLFLIFSKIEIILFFREQNKSIK